MAARPPIRAPHSRPEHRAAERRSVADGHRRRGVLRRRQHCEHRRRRARRRRGALAYPARPTHPTRRPRRTGRHHTWLARTGGGIMNAFTTHVTWYATRATGVVALVLLIATVVLGLSTVQRSAPRRLPRFVSQDLHRNISLLAVVFLGIHVATTIADSYTPIRWVDVVVPFASSYRPFWVGLGAVAADLVLALIVTSLA